MSKQKIIIGAHMLESITLGMYPDSKTIFREYIQNSCDAIDAAVKSGILQEGEGRIDIRLDSECRKITITDNGTGISAKDFQRVMGSVADSDKRHNENRGFRGIGRLCGLAYCGTLRFTAKFRGEDVISRLVCEAGTLRELLNERDSGLNRYTIAEVWDMINEFSSERTNDIDAHYFIVELEEINAENGTLLDYGEVSNYLSLTAPLPYNNTFNEFTSEIHKHAGELGLRISEYDIFLNDDQLFKLYTRTFPVGFSTDEVFALEFRDIKDSSGNLMAWLWFGVTCFKAKIKDKYLVRGIRLRKGNIQVGDDTTMQKFFAEERGNLYFVGELFCVSDELVLNSRRDYFNDCQECTEFEAAMEKCAEELTRLYKTGSILNSSYRQMKQAEAREIELKYKILNGYFPDEADKKKTEEELAQTINTTAKKKNDFDKHAAKSELNSKVAERIQTTYIYRGGGGGYSSN